MIYNVILGIVLIPAIVAGVGYYYELFVTFNILNLKFIKRMNTYLRG